VGGAVRLWGRTDNGNGSTSTKEGSQLFICELQGASAPLGGIDGRPDPRSFALIHRVILRAR